MIERLHQAPGVEAQAVVGMTTASPPSRWTLAAIRATFPWLRDYSLSGVWRLLRRLGLQRRNARVQQYSPDPEYLAKVERLLECLREAARAPGEVVVVFLDEMGYYRWPDPGSDWASETPVAYHGANNNRQWRIVGALNAQTGQVDYLENYIVGRRQLIAFYQQLAGAYPNARRIYVIQDNWSVHNHPEVCEALEGLPQLEVIWLPTYAPWLNPIEKLWRALREQVLKLHRLSDDWPTLRRRVNAFLDQFRLDQLRDGGHALLQYVGLLGDGKLAQAIRPS
jgi:transposase